MPADPPASAPAPLPGPVSIAPEDPASPEVAALLAAYRAELDERFPGGFRPPPAWAAAAATLVPPHGTLLVLRAGGEPLGLGAVRVLRPGVGELKHMWLSPRLRGHGLGRRLLGALEDAARGLGCTVVRLDTDAVLGEALALYESVGYGRTQRYNDNHAACAIFMERALPPGPPPGPAPGPASGLPPGLPPGPA